MRPFWLTESYVNARIRGKMVFVWWYLCDGWLRSESAECYFLFTNPNSDCGHVFRISCSSPIAWKLPLLSLSFFHEKLQDVFAFSNLRSLLTNFWIFSSKPGKCTLSVFGGNAWYHCLLEKWEDYHRVEGERVFISIFSLWHSKYRLAREGLTRHLWDVLGDWKKNVGKLSKVLFLDREEENAGNTDYNLKSKSRTVWYFGARYFQLIPCRPENNGPQPTILGGHIQQRSLKIREKSGRKSLRCRSLTLFLSRRNSVSNGQREWLIRQLSSNAHFRLLELSKNDEYLAQWPQENTAKCVFPSPEKKSDSWNRENVSGLDFERWLCDTPH